MPREGCWSFFLPLVTSEDLEGSEMEMTEEEKIAEEFKKSSKNMMADMFMG